MEQMETLSKFHSLAVITSNLSMTLARDDKELQLKLHTGMKAKQELIVKQIVKGKVSNIFFN